MSTTTLRKASYGRHIVPYWFKEILHAIIYSDYLQAYIAIQAITLFLGAKTLNQNILALHAHGLNHTQIAARLNVSRYTVIRAMKYFEKVTDHDTLLRVQTSPLTADILDTFLSRNYTYNNNIETVISFLWDFTCTELAVLSAILRRLTEEEATAHVCVSKSRYHKIKKRLLKSLDLERKTALNNVSKKSFWSLRETDRYDIICGVNGKVYFSVHFEGFILSKMRYLPPLLAVMFPLKHPQTSKSA